MNSDPREALRHLRKGDGLTLTALAMLPDVEETFGTDDYRAIRRAIVAAISSEHDDKGVAALSNALGVDTPGGLTLMERRERYIKQHRISMRTLTNYEELGAIVVAQMLPASIPLTSTGSLARDLALVEEIVQRSIRTGVMTDFDRTTALEALRRLQAVNDGEITARSRDRVIELMNQMIHLAALTCPVSPVTPRAETGQRPRVPLETIRRTTELASNGLVEASAKGRAAKTHVGG